MLVNAVGYYDGFYTEISFLPVTASLTGIGTGVMHLFHWLIEAGDWSGQLKQEDI